MTGRTSKRNEEIEEKNTELKRQLNTAKGSKGIGSHISASQKTTEG